MERLTEFTEPKLMECVLEVEVETTFIEPGNPSENGYCKIFINKIQEEFLNMEIFDTMFEDEILKRRRMHFYNTIRPHSSLGPNRQRHRRSRNSLT